MGIGTHNLGYYKDIAIIKTKAQLGLFISFMVLLFTFPLYVPDAYILSLINIMAITLVSVLGLNFLFGYCGQISIAQSAFMAVGAYTSGVLTTRFGLSFLPCMIASGLMAGVIGIVFGFSSLRLKGLYLVMATLAAQFIIMFFALHLVSITGGISGLRVPPVQLGSITFDSERSCYFLIMIITCIMTFFATSLSRTKVSRALFAIRDNEAAAEVMGISLFRYKLLAFFIGCFYAGIAGSMWGYYIGFVHPEQFTLMESIMQFGMVVIGGMGSIMGSVFGVVFVKGLDILSRDFLAPGLAATFPAVAATASQSLSQIVFGLALAVFLIFEPKGINHLWRIVKRHFSRWPLV